MVNYLVTQLEPFSNEDKDHRIRALEAKLAEQGKQTPSPPSSGNLPVADSANMAQPSKRRRTAVKSDLTKYLFDMNIGIHDRPLAANAPSSHNTVTVKKWWTGFKVKNMEGLQNVQARADSILAFFSEEHLMAILQSCYFHHVDYSRRRPCRAMISYFSAFPLFQHNNCFSQQVRTWRRRLQHLCQTSLQGFSSMMQRQFAVYALLHVNA